MKNTTQIHMLSVDTGHFYSSREYRLHQKNLACRRERNELAERLLFFDYVMAEYGYTDKDLNLLKKGQFDRMDHYTPGTSGLIREYCLLYCILAHKSRKAKEAKERLQLLLSHKASQNERTHGRDHIRKLPESRLTDTSVISVFESALTRMIGIRENEQTDALIVVQIYYFELFRDLSLGGFMYQGEQYRYYTSSAGQIRQKKAVFMKESVWNQWEQTILCGLTIDRINQKGGNNVNKHLAYMALTNSATTLWNEFDIDRTIVIDDFETDVTGTYDFIDEQDYSITRRTGPVPIPHTDGAGMVLPSLLERNAMFRAPWIKGLLGVFDFAAFIREQNCSPVIRDIYGREHHILEEDIQIIFTKSQFKMYRYYDSWEDYKACFQAYGCTAGLCSQEEPYIKYARINYQMLQTLTDVTNEEAADLAARSVQKLSGLCSTVEGMQEALGAASYNQNLTPFQRAVRLYPPLLKDPYAKDMLREVKNSLVKKYRSGKLEIKARYTFVLPDFYAACQFWFCHNPHPDGLLGNGQVYCRLFPGHQTLDCLRSPHLYREHAIRTNLAARTPGKELTDTHCPNLEKWFCTNAIYTSTHDIISKLLQFDVDGDKLLVAADETLLPIARRNMEGIVPLYYHMQKATPEALNSQSIYRGLHAAFTGAPIGVDSNDISKIWNSSVFQDGTPAQQQEALHAIKLLCMENNFHIDYAKTLYKPKRPGHVNHLISGYTRQKLPAFFLYAKDKEPGQVCAPTGSLVNRLYHLIPDRAINTRGLALPPMDYRLLMQDPDTQCPRQVSDLYSRMNKAYRYKINRRDEYQDNLQYVAEQIRTEFSALGYEDEALADMLVRYLYGGEKRCKELLWFCYGHCLTRSLEHHLKLPDTKCIQCTDCGELAEVPLKSRSVRCPACQKEHRRRQDRERKQRGRSSHSAHLDTR